MDDTSFVFIDSSALLVRICAEMDETSSVFVQSCFAVARNLRRDG